MNRQLRWRSISVTVPVIGVGFFHDTESHAQKCQEKAKPRPANPSFASTCVLPTSWTPCKLLAVTPYNHDTSIFEFEVSGRLRLPTCGCLLLKAPGKEHPWVRGDGDAVRPYTPISPEAMDGKFQLLIKRYREWGGPRPGEKEGWAIHQSYKPPGAVSNYLHELVPGKDSVLFSHRSENIKLQYPFLGVRRITMVAVGVGIAPMIQALEKVLDTPGDTTQVVLLYGNRSVKDVLMREKLDAWSQEHGHRFKVVHAVGSRWANVRIGLKKAVKTEGFGTTIADLQKPPMAEDFDSLNVSASQAKELGWVGLEVIRKHAFPPANDHKVFVCGLPGVYDKLCGSREDNLLPEESALARLGFESHHVIKF
mmetsp:Transcript_33501/g.68504  ORF Transcript_33501/g.68504 Transcript_33501/m.68504 type:complete len:366 (-) Transcript_33501:98-1195(-)